MRAVSKRIDLTPFVENDGVLSAILYKPEESWSEVEVEGDVNSMLSTAGNILSSNPPAEGRLRFVEVEAPGLKVVIGEGVANGVETILSPYPSFLRSIKLVKVEGETPRVVHEFKPGQPSIVYDSALILWKKLEYDLILVETSEGTRILFPHELLLERVKAETKGRRRRRKKAKRAKTSRRKSRKSKRGRRRRGSRR
jgi:hypothetical protein